MKKRQKKKAKKTETKKKKIFAFLILFVVLTVLAGISVFMFHRVSDPYGNIFHSSYGTTSKIGYFSENLGTVERQHPEIKDEGLETYPVYGEILYAAGEETNAEEKQALLDENAYLCAGSGTYDRMDAEGNLFLAGSKTGRKLYKHTASVRMYLGDVSDDEPALVKRIHIRSRKAGTHLTGLYAPAGEVIKIEMSEEDFEKTGGLIVYIGQVLENGQPNNIWKAREFNRMPVIANTMTIQDPISYVGSYLGGPIYVRPVHAGTSFTATITGGVAYPHFILGYTTEKEFEESRRSSAPYFDLEIWDDGVRHSGPKSYSERFSYEDLTRAAVLWDKISTVSNQVPSGSADIGITFLYDPFVAAGAACAFVGRNTVNCPLSWMIGSLDYDAFVTSGSWGNIHEYNHHYQRYGFVPGDEVTNNALSLVSYSQFTKISSGRTLTGSLSGWNRFTVPSVCLQETKSLAFGETANSQLDAYANVLHSFGPDAFIEAAQYGKGIGGADMWFRSLCEATGYDMTYYFTELLHQTVSESVLEEYAKRSDPMYVPVASVFQTGVRYQAGGEQNDIRTVQPFEINPEEDFDMDFNTYVEIPEGFSYRVKSVSSPQYGCLYKKSEGIYTYSPDSTHRSSGEFSVTLEITKDDRSFPVEDVELILELKQKANLLERTTYTYAQEKMYTDVETAYKQNYEGYENKTVGNNQNPVVNGKVVQNGNAEVWLPDPAQNSIVEIRGKVKIPSDGKYRFAVRGRKKAGLYLSTDQVHYHLAGLLENRTGDALFHPEEENSYSDYELKKGQSVYFKAVLLVTDSRSYVGVGWGKFKDDAVDLDYLYDAYRVSAEYEDFTSDYLYPREYEVDYQKTYSLSPHLVDARYQPWDENYSIDNLFDDDQTNFIHSDRTAISEENPFEMTVDLKETIETNRMTIYGEPTRAYQPKTFRLYGGETLNDMKLLKEVHEAKVTGNQVVVDFDMQKIRYYRLVVTDTYAPGIRYIAFRGVDFSLNLTGGRQYSPDDEIFVYRGDWKVEKCFSTFGHVYSGDKAVMEFEFTGTRWGIFSCLSGQKTEFKVYIDGVLLDTLSVQNASNSVELSYLSPLLEEGKHKVKIEGNGSFNIDSVFII